jgi:hypothetical protein
LKYFPLALTEVSRVRSESKQNAPDSLLYNLSQHARGIIRDVDGDLHLAKVARDALTVLEVHLGGSTQQNNEDQEIGGTAIYSNVLKRFSLALAEVSRVSLSGNKQHHPDKPLHWDKSKSKDELDALMRHLSDHSKGITFDTDGMLHLGKVAWRSLAALERYLEGNEI